MASTSTLSDPFSGAANLSGINLTGTSGADLSGVFSDPFGTNASTYSLGAGTPNATATPDTGGLTAFTPTVSPETVPSTTTGSSSILGDLGSVLSSAASSPLGTFGEYAGLYSILAGQAGKAQTQNNALAGQISALGQPEVTAGQNLLADQTAGTLGAPYQGQVSVAEQQNQNVATSQMQQVASLLSGAGGGNLQSAMATEDQQITSAQAQANQAAVSKAFTQQLTDSLALTAQGGQFVQSGITQEIQSNTQLQQQLSSLMGMLASAYAKQTSGTGTGTGASGGALGSLPSSLSKLWNDITSAAGSSGAATSVAKLLSQAGASGATQASTVASLESQGISQQSADQIWADENAALSSGNYSSLSQVDASLPSFDLNSSSVSLGDLTDASGNVIQSGSDITALSQGGTDTTALTDLSGSIQSDTTGLTDLTGSFSSAGGQAATAGMTGLTDAQIASSVTPDPSALNVQTPNISSASNIFGGLGAAGNIYNEVQNPTVGGGLSAASSTASLAGKALDSSALSTAGTALGGAAAGYGLYEALQNPSNPVNDVSAALDAYKLYGAANSLLGGGSTAAAGTTAAGASSGAGAASTAGLGVAAGAAAAIGGVLAPALIGMSTPAYTLGSSYYNTVNSTLKAGLSMTPDSPQFLGLAAQNNNFSGPAPAGYDAATWNQLQQMYNSYMGPQWSQRVANYVAAGGQVDANGNPIPGGGAAAGGGGGTGGHGNNRA